MKRTLVFVALAATILGISPLFSAQGFAKNPNVSSQIKTFNVYTASCSAPSNDVLNLPSVASLPSDSSVFIDDGNSKIDSLLENSTFLSSSGYVQKNIVQVIAVLGEPICSNVYSMQVLTDQEMVSFKNTIRQLGGDVTETYQSLPFAVVDLPYSRVDSLANAQQVSHLFLDQRVEVGPVDDDSPVRAELNDSVPIIKPPDEWSQIERQFGYAIDGTGVKIAILDTGVDASHPDFYFPNGTSKIVASMCFTGEGHTWDGFGHGTHCASIAAGTGKASNCTYVGVAPGASLMDGKVLSDQGFGYNSWIISGIQWAVQNGANVISMSLGAAVNSDGTDPLSMAVDWAVDQGVPCTIAAGNSGGTGMFSVGVPGCSRKAITVGATTKSDGIAWFSSTGPTADYRLKPDVCAPGVGIVAARAKATVMGTPINQYYTEASGTSMATPHVAGAVALLIQAHPAWSPSMLKAALIGSAKVLSNPLWVEGAGRVDLCAAINATLLAIEPSLSPGLLNMEDTTSASLVLMNVVNVSVSFNMTTVTYCDGAEVGSITTNVSSLTISGHQNTTISLQIGPFNKDAPGGWYEGWLNMISLQGSTRTPFLFLRGGLINTICINANGSVSPATAPVSRLDATTYALTSDVCSIADGIVVNRSNIILDGGSHTIKGLGKQSTTGISLIGKSNVTIRNFKLEAFSRGIFLNASSSCTVDYNNILAPLGVGIYAYSSSDANTIVGNTVTNSGHGIVVGPVSDSNLISQNYIANSFWSGIYCYTLSDYNTIVGNTVTTTNANDYGGINLLFSSNDNTVLGNNITMNWLGIEIWQQSSGNQIYCNNFVNNTYQVWCSNSDGTFPPNVWDDGSRGNYWSDYAGSDKNGDGIGEIPYVINSNNVDHYPLTSPCGSLTYALTIVATAGGSTDPLPGTHTYSAGGTVQVVAIPSSCYILDSWVVDGKNAGSASSINVKMNSNHTLQATFTRVWQLTVLSSAGGTTTPLAGNYTCTDSTARQIVANPGKYYTLNCWLLDGNNVGSSNPYTVLMDSNRTLQPMFAKMNYTLVISSTAGGIVTPAPGTYTYDASLSMRVNVNASASANYLLDHWILDGANVSSSTTLSFLMNRNHTLQAIFVPSWQLTLLSSPNGVTIPKAGVYVYANGTSVKVVASPCTYYLLNYWLLDGVTIGNSSPITISMCSNHTLQPFFAIINFTLTVSVSGSGTTNFTSGVYVYSGGTNLQVLATPSSGYGLYQWVLDRGNAGTANPLKILMNSNHTLQAVFLPIWRLTILSSANGGVSPVYGNYMYFNGTSVQVKATPSTYYVLDHWSLDGVNVGNKNPIVVSMCGNHTLQPLFVIVNYTLTISVSGSGATNFAPGVYVYSGGTKVQASATPSSGHALYQWVLDGKNAGTANPLTVPMSSNRTLQAVFKSIWQLTVKSSTGGTTSPACGNYTYFDGTSVQVKAIPNHYFMLDHWVLDDVNVGKPNPLTVLMSGNHKLQPFYAVINYTLTILSSNNGTTNLASGKWVYVAGTSVNVTATPNYGFMLDHWIIDSKSSGSSMTISVSMGGNHTLQAVFSPACSLAVIATTGGTTTPMPGNYTYLKGSSVQFTANATSGYKFDHWVLDGANAGNNTKITVNIDKDHVLQAVFVKQTG
jgi:parallel beta-helix repeat protein